MNKSRGGCEWADVEHAAAEDGPGLRARPRSVLMRAESKRIVALIACNSIAVGYLWSWSAWSSSLALRAYANALSFNVCALAVCLISIWVEENLDGLRECNAAALGARLGSVQLRLGPQRYEVAGLLASSCLCLLAQALLLVEALLGSPEPRQPLVHQGRLGLAALAGLVAHLATILLYPDAGLDHVFREALPCPTFRRINPLLAVSLLSFAILSGSQLANHFWQLYITDIAAAFAVIGLTLASILPLVFYTLSIILHKISHHMSEQLDKCLQEALVIDGVLEFRNERFWSKSFGKLSGSLEVRVRKNADENYVLQKVVKRLSQVVSTLNVKEFREPSNVANNFSTALPFEYYVDELLQNNVCKDKASSRQEQDIEIKNVLKMRDVLHCADGASCPVLNQGNSIDDNRATLSSYPKNLGNPAQKYFHPKVPTRNALLLGSRCNLQDLHCSARLHSS